MNNNRIPLLPQISSFTLPLTEAHLRKIERERAVWEVESAVTESVKSDTINDLGVKPPEGSGESQASASKAESQAK